MIIRKGYRYRLKTTPEVEHALRVQAGHARFVWNEALKLNRARLAQGCHYCGETPCAGC